MTATAFLVVAAILPALYLERVSVRSLARARHIWLWLVGALVLTVVAPQEPWLGAIGAYLLFWWRQPAEADPLRREPWERTRIIGWWVAIGALWFLALGVPGWVWAWLPTAWGVWAWACAAGMAWQYWARDRAKLRGWWATRSVAGAFLALILPLLPLWAWPGPLLGIWLSGPSYVAVLALSAASIVRWPTAMVIGPIVASIVLGVALRTWSPRLRQRTPLEWTPRGDSLDSMWQRLALLRLAWSTRSWAGTGPGTTPYLHLQAAARGQLAEATGTLHNEAAQLVSEYGVVGALAVGLFAYRIGPHLTLGDPWSSAVVAGAVLSVGTMALRVAPIGALWLLCCAEVGR